MNVDEAIEEARQFGEQEPKDMLFAEHIAIELAAEVERLRHEVEFLKESRDAFMLLAGRMISDSSKLGSPND